MIRQDFNRIDAKRRHATDYRKKQFADPAYKAAEYGTRLNLYAAPPTADITLEQFEQWAIDRLRGAHAARHVRPVMLPDTSPPVDPLGRQATD